MKLTELVDAVNWMKVQTGSLVCLGCGHEHNCSVHGCAILRKAATQLELVNAVMNETTVIHFCAQILDTTPERLVKLVRMDNAREDSKITKADRIRALTDEELAELMQVECPPTGLDACAETCTKCWLKWLQQPIDVIALEDLCEKSEIKLQEENDNE